MPQVSENKAGIMLLIIAAVGWYLASQSAADALSAGKNSPGRTILGYWMPTLLFVIAAIAWGRAEVALSVIFGASVAALTLVVGIVTITASDTRQTSPRRMWGFVLPTAMICFMIGFTGKVGWFDACVLLLEGFALLMLWNDGVEKIETIALRPRHAAMLLAALAAALVATLAGLGSIHDISGVQGVREELVTQALVGPLLVLPMIGAGTSAASQGKYDQAIATPIGYVLLNLCLLLPLAAVMWLGRSQWLTIVSAMHGPTTMPTTMPMDDTAAALPYPLGIWRIDTVLLAVLGLLLLPVALGRWTLGKAEGFAMLFGYAIYVVLSTIMAR